MSETFNGPHGEWVSIDPFDDAMVSPLRARVSMGINARGVSDPQRIIIVVDAAGVKVADSVLPFYMNKETQAKAAQWLLDLCCTRCAIEGIEFKHSDFTLTFKK